MTATVSQPTQANAGADVPVENGTKGPLASQDIGLIFVREYYTFLNKNPNKLYGFYGQDSFMVRGDEGQATATIHGQEQIRKKIEELRFEDCRVLVTQVDSQISANNGILVQVLGEMCNMDGPLQKFSQTFFLAPQTNGYYVLNDVFRFLKDEVNIDYHTCGEDKAKGQQEHKAAASIEAPAAAAAATTTTTTTAKPAAAAAAASTDQQDADSAAATTSSTPVIETANTQQPAATEEKPAAAAAAAPATETKPPQQTADKRKVDGKEKEQEKEQQQQQEQPGSKVPKTWSNIAAGSDNKWSASPPSGTAAMATATTPAAAAGTTTPPATTATTTSTAESKPSQGKPSHGKDHGREPPVPKEEATDVFLKNTKNLTSEQIKEVFAAEFGEVKSVTVMPGKPSGFLTFASPESCQRALKQRRVDVNEQTVLIEERRVPGSRYPRHPQNGTGGSYERRFQQNRRGGGPPRGGKSRGGGNQK